MADSPTAPAPAPSPAPAPGLRPRFAALRHRDFAIFLSGHVVSRVGTQVQAVALSWHIYLLTKSPIALGLIGAARVVPVLLLAIGGGVAADAYDRRRVMIATQAIMAGCSAAMAVATLTGVVSAPLLLALVAVAGGALAFDNPARHALVASLVPREDLANAMSLSNLAFHTATVVGPAVAGLLIRFTGLGVLYAVDALSFLALIAALTTVRARPAPPQPRLEAGIGAAMEGLRFLRSQPVLLAMMLVDFAATFLAGSMQLLPIYADQILEVGERGLGFLMAAPAAGSLLAALWLSLRPGLRHQGAVMLAAVVVYGLAIAGFGLSRTFALSLALLALSGAADTFSTVVRQVARTVLTPDHLRGRMISINQIFFMGGPQLGELEAGLLAAATSARLSVVAGGALCVLVAAAAALAVPALRRYRGDEVSAIEQRQ